MDPARSTFVFIVIVLLFFLYPCSNSIRFFPKEIADNGDETQMGFNGFLQFAEAPEYRNGNDCPVPDMKIIESSCDRSHVHIAMTLDSEYLRGSMAAIHSVLKHASCPENIFLHFIVSRSKSDSETSKTLTHFLRSSFPSLSFKVYLFKEEIVKNLISPSIRQALENPLNYARNYVADILEPCIDRVIYLDSDLILVDDIQKLWEIPLTGLRTIGAPEYCHTNFTKYFTDQFWSDPKMKTTFSERNPCYFNTGVMLIDLVRWREGNYRKRIEGWMELQKQRRIYELGSLPPFLLVFGGNIEAIDHRWNQHGLGGDNIEDSCRSLHPGPVSLLHWSGKGKPWKRLDAGKPCPVDHLWKPYDLFTPHEQEHQIATDLSFFII